MDKFTEIENAKGVTVLVEESSDDEDLPVPPDLRDLWSKRMQILRQRRGKKPRREVNVITATRPQASEAAAAAAVASLPQPEEEGKDREYREEKKLFLSPNPPKLTPPRERMTKQQKKDYKKWTEQGRVRCYNVFPTVLSVRDDGTQEVFCIRCHGTVPDLLSPHLWCADCRTRGYMQQPEGSEAAENPRTTLSILHKLHGQPVRQWTPDREGGPCPSCKRGIYPTPNVTNKISGPTHNHGVIRSRMQCDHKQFEGCIKPNHDKVYQSTDEIPDEQLERLQYNMGMAYLKFKGVPINERTPEVAMPVGIKQWKRFSDNYDAKKWKKRA